MIKKIVCILCVLCILLTACSGATQDDVSAQAEPPVNLNEDSENSIMPDITEQPADNNDSGFEGRTPAKQLVREMLEAQAISAAQTIIIEAEDAALLGNTRVDNTIEGFSGSGYAAGFERDGDACEFTVMIDQAGFYDLNFVTATLNHGYKENNVYINGEPAGVVAAESEGFADSVIKRMYLEQGENIIKYEKYWGWMYLDRLEVSPSAPIDASVFDVSARLINPNASENAKALMRFLTDIYGGYILSGQYSDNGNESFTIRNITGKTPAVLGLDMMEYTPSRVLYGTTGRLVNRAVTHHELGGITTFCWHWNAPEDYLTGTWYRGFYTDETNIDLKKIMDGEDEKGYELLLRDIDAISEELKVLRDADIPILWRPLHEAAGGWFWWGAAGPEANIALWKLLYERMTEYHGLNNLIWLWNGQAADWYPGDEYVDIIGEDIYAGEHNYASQIGKFMEAVEYTNPPKMVVLSENGTLFDPDLALRDGAMWGFFAVWGGDFVLRANLNRYNEKYTEQAMLEKVYAHERVLSLEDLPDWKGY